MSLIERAADMLTPVSETNRKPSQETGEPGTAGPVIERAVSSKGQHPNLSTTQERVRETPSDRAPIPAGDPVRVCKIDVDRLRRQNVITPDSERSAISENFRRIKRHILANITGPDAGPTTNLVMITSALPGEGKTFCAVNLAISIAMEMDRTVLLVDADVARPTVTSVLGIQNEAIRGLMDILRDPSADLTSVLCKTDIGKLSILPAGTRHARSTEMLASERMRVLLEEMARRYHDRIIIFDSPPLLAASEASVLASRMGQILVVVESGRTTETALKDALARIEPRNVLGVVLNKGKAPGDGYYGGYDYGYGYG